MRIRYLVTDDGQTLRKAFQAHLEGAWSGKRQWDESGGTKSLGIVTVLCDLTLKPFVCTKTRVQIVNGWISDESKQRAVSAWIRLKPVLEGPGIPSVPRQNPWTHPDVVSQLSNWPDDASLKQQLAIVLDVPIEHVPDFVLGGPLVASFQLGIGIEQAKLYFQPDSPADEDLREHPR